MFLLQEHSLAPSVVINALTKGIAKKLGADSFGSQDEKYPDKVGLKYSFNFVK